MAANSLSRIDRARIDQDLLVNPNQQQQQQHLVVDKIYHRVTCYC